MRHVRQVSGNLSDQRFCGGGCARPIVGDSVSVSVSGSDSDSVGGGGGGGGGDGDGGDLLMSGGAVGEAAGAAQVAEGVETQLVIETQFAAARIKSGCCARDRCARLDESQRVAGVIGVVQKALVVALKVGDEFGECELDIVVAARLTCPHV